MFEALFNGHYLPFTIALCLPLVVLGVELLSLMLGSGLVLDGSTGSAGPSASSRAFDLVIGEVPDMAALIVASDAAYHAADLRWRSPMARLWRRTGCRTGPSTAGIAAIAGATGLAGVLLQTAATAVTGAPLPVMLALVPASLAGWVIGRRLQARLPGQRSDTSACGGLRGQVIAGNARAGVPARVLLRARDGTALTIACEPFDSSDIIAEGSAVMTVRTRLAGDRWVLRLLALD